MRAYVVLLTRQIHVVHTKHRLRDRLLRSVHTPSDAVADLPA